jgi:RsiW-degrading membrane proteinase PrsW (M82 family)
MQITGIIISLFFGFVPMLIFAYLVYWIDRYEKEPLVLIGGVFLWGAIIAAGAAFIVNTFLGLGVYLFTGSQAFTELSTGSAIAPIIEETLKGMAVLIVFLFFRGEFDTVLDGIVYAAIAAIGFAATENSYYIFTYGFQENGLSGILWMSFVRVILVGWQHPFYTAFIGIGFAVARLNRNWAIRIIAPFIGWGAAILAHSFHNTVASFLHGLPGLALGTLFDWSGWLVMLLFVLWALYREQRWIINQLREEVTNGVITPAQYRIACSAWAQVPVRMKALFSGRYRQTNRFFNLTAELAYKKQHRASLGEEKENTPAIDSIRSELAHLTPLIST